MNFNIYLDSKIGAAAASALYVFSNVCSHVIESRRREWAAVCFAMVNFQRRCCSICRSKVRHLVCVRLHEGRSSRGARDIVTTGCISC
jgi:hypothetical protein